MGGTPTGHPQGLGKVGVVYGSTMAGAGLGRLEIEETSQAHGTGSAEIREGEGW